MAAMKKNAARDNDIIQCSAVFHCVRPPVGPFIANAQHLATTTKIHLCTENFGTHKIFMAHILKLLLINPVQFFVVVVVIQCSTVPVIRQLLTLSICLLPQKNIFITYIMFENVYGTYFEIIVFFNPVQYYQVANAIQCSAVIHCVRPAVQHLATITEIHFCTENFGTQNFYGTYFEVIVFFYPCSSSLQQQLLSSAALFL